MDKVYKNTEELFEKIQLVKSLENSEPSKITEADIFSSPSLFKSNQVLQSKLKALEIPWWRSTLEMYK